MKRGVSLLFACLSLATFAANFLTPEMLKRNGLTDEQYALLWAQGNHPTIDGGAARQWMFKASRYQNVTNWLDICGASNDFAKLSYNLQDSNFKLEVTNRVLVATNHALSAQCETLAAEAKYYFDAATNSLAKVSSLSNALVIVTAQAEAATAKIQDEIADLEAKIEKYEEYQTKYPLLKSVWTALISDAENRIKILQALTGGAQ